MSCRDVADEAVRVSNGALIKITHGELTSRSSNELICHGTGVYATGQEVSTRYRAFVDDDGDTMISYDQKEAIEDAAESFQREMQRQQNQNERDLDNAVDQLQFNMRFRGGRDE